MAKDKSTLSKDERKALKAAKKEAKASKPEGVTKPEKKDKKDKKAHTQLAERALKEIQNVPTTKDDGSDDEGEADEDAEAEADAETEVKAAKTNGEKARQARPIGALVPFANPLADEKVAKKVFKGVKKAAVQRTLKRGVKEVVKALRKAPSDASTVPQGIVVLAADISPMDVISHIPVLCEDHGIPYIYVASRAELGMAGQTKRPTSVVLLGRDVGKGKDGKVEEGDWKEVFEGLVKVVQKEGGRVKV